MRIFPTRVFPMTLALFTLGLVLPGCPIIAGIDHDYSAGATLPDGSQPETDGGASKDGGRDGSVDGTPTKDGTVDGRTDAPHTNDGQSPPDSPTTDSNTHDVVTPPVDSAVDACTATCSLTAPMGWTLVGFDGSGSNTCPTSGFTQTNVASPAGGGSCACSGCVVNSPPDCTSGTITSKKSVSPATTCTAVGNSFNANDGLCDPGSITSAPGYSSFAGPPPTGGTCTAQAGATNPAVNPGVFCQSSTSCGSSVCGLNQGKFRTCLYQLGDQVCPSIATTKHVIGSSVTTSCDTCSCSATATGCTGQFTIFGPMGCGGGQMLSIPADGTTCAQLTGVAAGDSFLYSASPTGVSCTNGTSNPTDTINDQATICCP